jgi:hypothetical protein
MSVNLKSPGTLEAGPTATLTSLSGQFIEMDQVSVSPAEVVLAVASRNGDDRNLHVIHVPWPAFDPITVEWTRTIVPPCGPWVALWGLEESGGNLYLAGSARDSTRPADGNGNRWASGVAASYTNAGDLRWIKTINVSKYADQLFGLSVGPTAVYATGNAAFFFHNTTDVFGYGFVSKIDPNDGHVIASFTVGDENYSSGFYDAAWTGSAMICGGWTLDDQSSGPYRGWLVTLDVSGTSPAVIGRGTVDPDARVPSTDLRRKALSN